MKPNPMDVYKLAYREALNYIGRGVPFEDLLNTAMLGVCEACKRLDTEKGALTTYSVYWINHELRRAVYRRVGAERKSTRRFSNNESFNLIEHELSVDSDAYNSKLLDDVNQKVNIILNKLSSRQALAFRCYYYLNDYESYKLKYNSTEAQARKEASNTKVKVYQKLKELI